MKGLTNTKVNRLTEHDRMGQHFFDSPDADRHDWHTRPLGEDNRARLARVQSTVDAAVSFWKDADDLSVSK